MAESTSSTTELEKLLHYNISDAAVLEHDENAQSDAVSKFMNGEISFSDCLLQMEDNPVKNETISVKVDESAADVIDAASIASFDHLNLSEFSEASFSENEDSDDGLGLPKSKKTSKKKKQLQKSKLSPTLKALMGQANVCYAQNDTESAVKMCLEIIREEPNASEPFRTLSSIYESIGQSEKSLQMRLLAAHLGPTDKEEWIQIATIFEASGEWRKAVSALTRAISSDPVNVALYDKRAALMKKAHQFVEDYGYNRLLRKLNPKTDGQTVVRIRNIVGSSYCKDKKYEKACEVLKYIFDSCEEFVTFEEVDLYTDALVCMKNYEACLSILEKFCQISVVMKYLEEKNIVENVIVPADLPTKIRMKLIMFLIYMHSFDFARSQIEILLNDDLNDHCQYLYDIAVFLIEKNQYEDALLLLTKLKESEMASPDIWFKITHCHKELHQMEECFSSYRKAILDFPDDSDLKLKFCDELKTAGLYREAVEITLENESSISLLIYERCKLYYLLQDFDAFIDATLQLFRLHFIEINSPEEFTLFDCVFRNAPKGMREKLSPYLAANVDHSVSVEEEWQLFLKVCNLYIERKEYDLFQWLAFSLWLSFKFIPKRPELRLVMTIACVLNEDYEFGFDLTRYTLLQSDIKDRHWSLFHLATYRTSYSRLHKFLIRHLIKNPDEKNALTMYANNCLSSGSYKYALTDYSLLYEQEKTPFLALLIALNLLHISCQKFTSSKHLLVAEMIAFITKYQELRGKEASQEVFYNIGRAFHQIELLPQAIFYYKKALSCKPAIDDCMFDLTSDVAFNLHLIYRSSGQSSIADWYLQKYVVI